MTKTLALFDFDHTLYRKDSLLEFTKFHLGNRRFYLGILYLFPQLGGLKMGILNNQKVKLKYFDYFFRNVDFDRFYESAHRFAITKIDNNLNHAVFAQFKNHLAAGDTVCIVTASAPDWIQPWSVQFGVPVIGTKLEKSDNLLTGKFASQNCHGSEKVSRITEVYNLSEFKTIAVYGSGAGDIDMLRLAKG